MRVRRRALSNLNNLSAVAKGNGKEKGETLPQTEQALSNVNNLSGVAKENGKEKENEKSPLQTEQATEAQAKLSRT